MCVFFVVSQFMTMQQIVENFFCEIFLLALLTSFIRLSVTV